VLFRQKPIAMRSSSSGPATSFDSARKHGARDRIEEPSAIHAALRERTALFHRRLEEHLDLLDRALSRDRYCRVIRAFLGFYAPVENGLARVALAAPPVGFSLVARAPLLRRDVIALGATTDEVRTLPICACLPRLQFPEDLAGCLYVLEGASLGGQVISRALARHLGIDQRNGAAFFAGDADRTFARWKRVLAWLNAFDDSVDAVATTACETFSTLERWLQTQGATQ
jgi:heme oxygenase